MPGKNRLQKRQAEYRKASGIYLKPEQEDLFINEKRDAVSQIRRLNIKLAALTPFNEDGSLKSEDMLNSKLSEEDCDSLIDLYQKSIKSLHKLVTAINYHIDNIDEEAYEQPNIYYAESYNRERKACEDMVVLFDKITKTMSKDLRALDQVKKKGLNVSLDTVFENSRVNSEYQIVGEIKQTDKGNQNERIPMTIVGKDGNPMKGYFTRDSKPKTGRGYIKKAIRDARKKYGKDAKFLSTSAVMSLYNEFVDKNEGAINSLLGDNSKLAMMGYDEAVALLSNNMGNSLKSYINTPQKLNMFIDVVGKGFSAINQDNILGSIGINENARINRRNAAMSKMAELLGCPELIAESENIKIKINGRYVKGTFMKEAKGEDIRKIGKDSLMLDSTSLGGMNLDLKKQVATLQILDYLCGNPDRHSGNMLYYFEKGENGRSYLKRIQGIDNDSALGSEDFNDAGMSSVLLDSMKVIPEELSNRVMNIDKEALKQMLYGFDMTTKEVNNALNRLTTLQDKLRSDAKEYTKGYTEGYIIPKTIKAVSDEELSGIPFEELASLPSKNKKNQFERIGEIMKSGKNVERYISNAKANYCKACYDLTVGSIEKMSSLIGDLNKDNRLGGSSKEYNNMLTAMKSLNKKLVSFNGPVCGKGIDTDNDHVKELKEIREKIRETLISVNDYIYYKNSKKKGEEWRNIKEPHEMSRTERRFHDAERCCEFLTSQLEKFEKLTEKRVAYNEIKAVYDSKESEAELYDLNVWTNDDYTKQSDAYTEKLYKNHISRSKFEIKEALDKIDASEEKYKPYRRMNYDMKLGYGLYSVKPEDKENFKKEVEELTGQKITKSEDELLKRAIAADMIVTKASCEEKIKNAEKNPRIKVSSSVINLYKELKHIEIRPYDKAVDNLLHNDTFDDFFKSYKTAFHIKKVYEQPGSSAPDLDEMKCIAEAYNKALFKKHPDLAPKEPQTGKNKAPQKNVMGKK